MREVSPESGLAALKFSVIARIQEHAQICATIQSIVATPII